MIKMLSWPRILGNNLDINLNLSRMHALLAKLGNPHDKLSNVVHVAGTNGKGSSIAFLASILRCSGYSVNTYTSPHLLNFNERISINGTEIDDHSLNSILAHCKSVSEQYDIPVTFFEGTTLIAIMAFVQFPADITIIETGLGGRLDATNVFARPLLNMITSISMDHSEYLGTTIELIAKEKAGILKNNVPCVVGQQQESVMQVMQNVANDVGALLFRYGHEWSLISSSEAFIYQEGNNNMQFDLPTLIGSHQVSNAGNAVAATCCIADKFPNITRDSINQGITKTYWPGRMENITDKYIAAPLADNMEIWIDGAHNYAGMEALAYQVNKWKDKRNVFIVGITKGRNVPELISPLSSVADLLIGVRVKSELLAYPAYVIAETAKKMNFNAHSADELDEAITHVIKTYGDNTRIIICGSLYLYSDFNDCKQ